MQRIMIVNSKGGCGKTTLATNLASYYAAQGHTTVLMDHDPQGSSTRWLSQRPVERPRIHGIAVHQLRADMTRSFQMKLPPDTARVIIDVPAGLSDLKLAEHARQVDTILVPVLPSPTDIRAAAHFIHEMLLVGKIVRDETRVAVVANRVRENSSMQNAMESVLNSISINYSTLNTQIYRNLERFLSRLKIPFIATLRESQNYLVADARGLGVFDLPRSQVARDIEHWEPLLKWLESKRSIPEPAR